MNTVVLQSQSPAKLSAWQRRCMESVAQWAQGQGFEYRASGDELFDLLPEGLEFLRDLQPVVATDIARLVWLRRMLEEGWARAIWCDADLLIFRRFSPADHSHAFGREHWVQADGDALRSYRKIHNAYLQFSAGDPVLPFYLDRCLALARRVAFPVAPQFFGPKLLTALHNIVGFAVEERVGMLSPLAMRDLCGGGGTALDALLAGHEEGLCAVNLCASLEGRETDAVVMGAADYDFAIDRLLRDEELPRGDA